MSEPQQVSAQTPKTQKKPLLPGTEFSSEYEYPDGAMIKYSFEANRWRAWWKPKEHVHSLHRSVNNVVSYYKTAEEAANAFKGSGEGPDCPEWNYWGRTLDITELTKEQLDQYIAERKAWRATQPVLPLQIGDKILVECTYQGDHNTGRGMIGVHEATTCYPVSDMMVMSVPSSAIRPAVHVEEAQARIKELEDLLDSVPDRDTRE